MFKSIQSFDISVLDFINLHCHNPVLDKLMPLITSLGNLGIIWIIISVALIINKKHRKTGIMVLGSLILASILGDGLIKHLVQRPRPCAAIPASELLIAKPLSYSFPSGHTGASFAAAGILIKKFKKSRVLIILLASAIAFSRLYLYVHYPTDIIGGIILGLFCSAVVCVLADRNLVGAKLKSDL